MKKTQITKSTDNILARYNFIIMEKYILSSIKKMKYFQTRQFIKMKFFGA
jgi:hypothetical protein